MQFKEKELKMIKTLVEEKYGFSLSDKGRRQELVYAKKVYARLAKDRGHTFDSIGKTINNTHATILFHYNSFNVLYDYDYAIYYDCLAVLDASETIDEKGLSIQLDEKVSEDILKAKYEAELTKLRNKNDKLLKENNNYKSLKPVLSLMDGWSESDIVHFVEYRLKPYSTSLNDRMFRDDNGRA